MNCLKCKKDTKVIDSRNIDNCVRRRRVCNTCGYRFTTYENPEIINISVIKRDKSLEKFDRQKIYDSLQKACNKRPISKEKIDTITCEIETEIFKNYTNEIDSRDIGKLVLKKLMKLDKIAYLRFASVYKNFSSINKFSKEIDKINKLNK